ncbi:MAG: hypothetical protein CMI02_14160 [Oceanospirillaceae bacterium]|nr:hypothetical protein [Oceanospirillaceae bacterium]MBT13168.1 hypothetical protein [Oceanospirillaceae bacterium]
MLLISSMADAALTALSDEQLSNQTGQAFLQIDRDAAGSFDFTRFTFGMDVDVSLNADLVELGNYVRDGEPGADIRINDFALGSVNGDGTLNPFNIQDPYFELAFETIDGKEELVGVRLGFTEALGKLSGNIESLTGNIEVDVVGTADPIYEQANFGQRLLLGIAGVDRDTVLRSNAVLVDEDGNPQQVRAEWVGIPNGTTLNCESGCNLGGLSDGLLGLFGSDGCQILGIDTCFPLNTFRTLDIGDTDNGQSTQGMFLSFQTKQVAWLNGGEGTPATAGAFMNIPNGGISVDFEESFNGIQRIRTKFLDPYYD